MIAEAVEYLHPDERDDFYEALTSDDELDMDVLLPMLDSIRTAAYSMPYPAVLTLWDAFTENRPLLHGRLLAGGNPSGVDRLDAYDAACLALTLYDESWAGLPGWTFNEKGRRKLYDTLGLGQKAVGDSELDALAALQAEMGIAPGQQTITPRKRPRTEPPADG